MKKFLSAVLFLILCGSVYPETLSYFDENKQKYVTVNNVYHGGWYESYETISGAGTRNVKILTYTTIKGVWQGAQWAKWELVSSAPLPPYTDESFITDLFIARQEIWRKHPGAGAELSGGGIIKGGFIVGDVPTARSTPHWLDEAGNLHSFAKVYYFE